MDHLTYVQSLVSRPKKPNLLRAPFTMAKTKMTKMWNSKGSSKIKVPKLSSKTSMYPQRKKKMMVEEWNSKKTRWFNCWITRTSSMCYRIRLFFRTSWGHLEKRTRIIMIRREGGLERLFIRWTGRKSLKEIRRSYNLWRLKNATSSICSSS